MGFIPRLDDAKCVEDVHHPNESPTGLKSDPVLPSLMRVDTGSEEVVIGQRTTVHPTMGLAAFEKLRI